MRVTYDRYADAAYIYLNESGLSKVAWTYLCDPRQINGMINLDFDASGHLMGIEVMDASKKLSKQFLDAAEQIGSPPLQG